MAPESAGIVFFLCRRADLVRERLGYARAFARRGIEVKCLDDVPGARADVAAIAEAGLSPLLILHPDPQLPVMPAGLATSTVPTACFHIDSFIATERRAQWSLLFDRVFVFHQADLARFRAAGHAHVVPLFHAAEADGFRAAGEARELEVAVVARTGDLYHRRRACLEALDGGVRSNDWRRDWAPEEVARLYGGAKIVLNVGRDDRPDDVGVRFGEAMIAGALFATIRPTELTTLGYAEGRDFIEFAGPQDVVAVCRRYLDDEPLRARIAAAGQARTAAEHTYDHRVDVIVSGLQAGGAPARAWHAQQVALARMDYFAAKAQLRQALALLPRVGLGPNRRSAQALGLVARALASRAVGTLSAVRVRWGGPAAV